MLVGTYPFADSKGRQVFVVRKIMKAEYTLPSRLRLSHSCKDLIRRMFTLKPVERICIAGIKQHPWFTRALPARLEVCPRGSEAFLVW